jgi:SAM-dependent methyltransferase
MPLNRILNWRFGRRENSGTCFTAPDLDPFNYPEALALNRARLDHLEKLGLPIEGRSVLDAGCGVGHLAQFFVKHNCRTMCVDARPENIERLRSLYPGLEASAANVESGLTQFGQFDIVFCYGLLYHLENPILGIRNMAEVCRDLFLLETMVCDSEAPVCCWEEETLSANQAVHGVGCRPSPSFVKLALNLSGFPFVYTTTVRPQDADFEVEWKNSLKWRQSGHLIRSVFVASRQEIPNPNLVPLRARRVTAWD